MPSGSEAGAVVLCGGQSMRMGRPKAWLPFPAPGGGDEPLLVRIIRQIAPAVGPIVVVAAPDQAVPPLDRAVRIVRDPITGKGPLVGILAGLEALQGAAELAFVTSTDVPFMNAALVRRLVALRTDDIDLVVPCAHGHQHPLSAVYTQGVRPHVEVLLAEGRLRTTLLFARARTLVADAALLFGDEALATADPELRSLFNVNTPGDYRDALASLGPTSRPGTLSS